MDNTVPDSVRESITYDRFGLSEDKVIATKFVKLLENNGFTKKHISEIEKVNLDETVREKSSGFPDKQLKLLIKWVALHRDAIINNHAKCNHSENPDAVRPLTKAQIIKI